jgi:hypothetical protein
MRRLQPWLLSIPLILLPLISVGCAKRGFTYIVDDAFRPAAYRTVAADPQKDRVLIREGLRPLEPSYHRRLVLAELAGKRYEAAAPDVADLWIDVYVLTESGGAGHGEASGKHREGSGGGRRGGRGGGFQKASQEGGGPPEAHEAAWGHLTVIVQFQDRKTGQTVWQGEGVFGNETKGADGAPISPEEIVRQLLTPLPARP